MQFLLSGWPISRRARACEERQVVAQGVLPYFEIFGRSQHCLSHHHSLFQRHHYPRSHAWSFPDRGEHGDTLVVELKSLTDRCYETLKPHSESFLSFLRKCPTSAISLKKVLRPFYIPPPSYFLLQSVAVLL